jgi:hypothetical protein
MRDDRGWICFEFRREEAAKSMVKCRPAEGQSGEMLFLLLMIRSNVKNAVRSSLEKCRYFGKGCW